jgi:transcriptional regulator with XRE-family HTH domain
MHVNLPWYSSLMPRPRRQPLPTLDIPAEPIGTRLANIRKSKGLTQVEVGNRIGIDQYLVSDYETGRLHLSDDMLIRFATALGTSADTILGLDGSQVESPSLKLVKRLKKIEELPSAQQKALLQTIDGFLKGAGV